MPKPSTRRATTRKRKSGAHAEATAPEDHDHRDSDVDLLAADDVGQAPEGKSPDKGAQDGRSGDPTGLERAEVPLDGNQGGHRADDEEVVGVGEEPDPRNDHRTAVKLARRSLVQQIGDRLAARSGVEDVSLARHRLRQAISPPRKHTPTLAGLGEHQTIFR